MLRPPGRTVNVTGSAREQAMRSLNFDQVVKRRGSDCLKYDAAEDRGYPPEALPLWVADMDFPAAPPILEALRSRLEHGIFGYTHPPEGYRQAIMDWWKSYHNYTLKPEWILDSPGVVFSLATAIRALTKPGDSVLVQTPVYYPFYNAVQLNGRQLVPSPLTYANKEYTIDFEAFEERLVENRVRLFILCNPHNPVGRVWSPLELQRLGQICLRHEVLIISDEIHCEFVAPGFKHQVLAGLSPQLEQITVTLTAPSKTFNLSGLQISQAFIANEDLRKTWLREKTAAGLDGPNAMGLSACQSAYEQGRDWLEQLLAYIDQNETFVRDFLSQFLSGVHAVQRQGTYLLWLDCWGAGYNYEELNRRLIEKGKLWLHDGNQFGGEGKGFQRLNLACPRETLNDAMMRLAVALGR